MVAAGSFFGSAAWTKKQRRAYPTALLELIIQDVKPGTTEASAEKHIPSVTAADDIVQVSVGSIPHPMTEDHSIHWVYLQTTKGGQRKCLKPGDTPSVTFSLTGGERPVAVFAYCNLHGLWKAEL